MSIIVRPPWLTLLTGLFHRHALERRAAELIEQARIAHTPLAVSIGDLDHFKAVNDSHGHLFGGEVLREIANTLRIAMRNGRHLSLRRRGIRDPRPGQRDSRRARRRRAPAPRGRPLTTRRHRADDVLRHRDHQFDNTQLGDLLRAADQALYRARADGRNRVCVGSTLTARSTDSYDEADPRCAPNGG